MLLERGGQAGKAVLPAELGIEPVMIDDIIAMRASRPSFQEWRGIKMRNSQFLEIGNERGRLLKVEIFSQLDAIRRARDRRGHHYLLMAA